LRAHLDQTWFVIQSISERIMSPARLKEPRGYFGRSDRFLLTIWIAFVVLIFAAIAWSLASSTKRAPNWASPGAERSALYRGTIIAPLVGQNGCVEYIFDNQTGTSSRVGEVACSEHFTSRTPPFPESTTELRFRSVKNTFTGRLP
jgi:hypothetical protein